MFVINHYLEPILLSGTDGIITVFNLLVGLSSANFNISNIVRIVIIAIFGDSLSMAISYYNSKHNEENETDRIKQSIANMIAFIVFGSICLFTYIALTGNRPNTLVAYVSAIIPLIILASLLDNKKEMKKVVVMGLIGSILVYAIGQLAK